MGINIPYGRQNISDSEISEVISTLQSDYLTQGPKIPEFEESILNYVGASYAVAVNSATSALHIAYLALGIGPGDIVWTSPNTFVATSNAAIYCGASVDFVDINPQTYNLDIDLLKEKLAKAASLGKLPKLLVPVHFAGQPCDMKVIFELSKKYGFKIIEDASHAIGADYLDSKVGSCRYSDITVFSFHPVKIITTAEGGAAVTNDINLAESMRLLRSHGITRDELWMDGKSDGPWYYQQINLGFNYRITDLQAALGVAQMKRLDLFVEERRRLAKQYDDLLANLPIVRPYQSSDGQSSFHLYPVCIDTNNYSRLAVFNKLRELGIGANVHYIPVHTQPYYAKLGFYRGQFPNAERYYESTISIPLYYGLGDNLEIVVEAVRKSLNID